jgi:cell division protein FtsL
MKNEKVLLVTIFTLFFALSASLIFVMIKKDLKQEQEGRKWINEEVKNPKPENSWPRVEIQTSK